MKRKRNKVVILIPPSEYSKNVARDLLWGCWCSGKRIAAAEFPNTSALMLYTISREARAHTIYVDSTAEKYTMAQVNKIMKDYEPDFVFVPTATMTFKEDAKTLRKYKELCPNLKTVIYGSHPTFFSQKALEEDGIDFILTHEHEGAARELLEAFKQSDEPDLTNIKGLGYKDKNGKAIVNERREWDSLDELPIADRAPILKYSYYNPQVKKVKWTTMITSKGCPGKCNFCTTPRFYGNTWRAMSPERVVEEMEYLYNLGYQEIFFRDETWTGSFKRTDEICKLLIKKKLHKKITWICSTRVNTIRDEDQVRLMKKAGCHLLRFGVESGDDQVLTNIKKFVTSDFARKTLTWCNNAKMDFHAHTMVGCPGETWETVDKTIKFLIDTNPTTVTCGAYTPYPGTEIFDEVAEKDSSIADGTTSRVGVVHLRGYYSHKFSSLSEDEVGEAVKRVYKKFYIRPKYFFKTLMRIRSLDEFRRIMFAGLETVSFIFERPKKACKVKS